MEDFGDFQQFDEFNPLVLKFESMLLKGENPFFDIDDYEEIIEYYLNSNIDHAENVIDYALSQHPWNTVILLKKAIVAAIRQKPEEAYEIIDTVKSIDSDNLDFYVTVSYIYRTLNQYQLSTENLLKALKFKEDVEDIYLDIADNYQILKLFDEEITYLKKCLNIKPEYPEAIEKLFNAYKNRNLCEEAASFFQQFTNKNPLVSEGWESLGNAYYEIGLYEKSIEAYEYGLSITDSSSCYLGIANSYWKLGLNNKAINILTDALEKWPIDFAISNTIGRIFLDINDYINAEKYFLNGIFLFPYHANPWKGLSQIFIHKGDYVNAFSCLKKVTEINDNETESFLLMANVANKLEIPSEKIEEIFHIAIAINPSDYKPYIEFANYLFENEQLQEAIDLLEIALNNKVFSVPIFYRLAAYNYIIGRDTIGHLHLIAGLKADPDQLFLLFEVDSNLTNNTNIMDIIDSFKSNNINDEDI